MPVRMAEIKPIFRKIQVKAHIAFIVVNQNILRVIVSKLKNKSNRNRGKRKNDGQVHQVFNCNHIQFTMITMKNNFQVTCGFFIAVQVATIANPWNG
jgi:hypothetical protein